MKTEIIVEFPSPLKDKEKKMIYGYKGELIRCKDCKWHQGKDCMAWDDGTVAVANEVEDEGYCYLAERKDNAV